MAQASSPASTAFPHDGSSSIANDVNMAASSPMAVQSPFAPAATLPSPSPVGTTPASTAMTNAPTPTATPHDGDFSAFSFSPPPFSPVPPSSMGPPTHGSRRPSMTFDPSAQPPQHQLPAVPGALHQRQSPFLPFASPPQQPQSGEYAFPVGAFMGSPNQQGSFVPSTNGQPVDGQHSVPTTAVNLPWATSPVSTAPQWPSPPATAFSPAPMPWHGGGGFPQPPRSTPVTNGNHQSPNMRPMPTQPNKARPTPPPGAQSGSAKQPASKKEKADNSEGATKPAPKKKKKTKAAAAAAADGGAQDGSAAASTAANSRKREASQQLGPPAGSGPSAPASSAQNSASGQTQGQQKQGAGLGGGDQGGAAGGVLGGSGIDLRAEEEAMRSREVPAPLAAAQAAFFSSVTAQATPSTSSAAADRPGTTSVVIPSTRSLPYLQYYPLSSLVHSIAAEHDLGVDPEVLNILSAATRIRFRNLLECMVNTSRHRCWSTHERPPPMHERVSEDPLDGTKVTRRTKKAMYHEELLSDPSTWLAAIEKAERGEESKARKRRAQRQAEAMRAAAGADASGGIAGPSTAGIGGSSGGGAGASGSARVDGDGDEAMQGPDASGSAAAAALGASAADAAERKKKVKPPSAKNVSEDIRRRLANNTAARALGGMPTPKWMMMGGAASGFSTPTRNAKAEDGGDGDGGTDTPGSSLPKPRFAPPPTAAATPSWATGSLAPSGLAGTPLRASSTAPGDGPPSTPSGAAATAAAAAPESPRARRLRLLEELKVNPHGWGDPALRALAKEEEERKRRRKVQLGDALHALEVERKGGAGRGSGEEVLFKWRSLGKGAGGSGTGSGFVTGTGAGGGGGGSSTAKGGAKGGGSWGEG